MEIQSIVSPSVSLFLFDVFNPVMFVVSCMCGCCVGFRVSVGVDFQEELSDMLLLKMLQAATQASADKDRVRRHQVA